MNEIIGRFKKSKATSFIMLINLVVFILILINGGFTSENLLRFGASNSELITSGQYYRVLSQLFVHVSLVHFIFNMFVICMMASSVEKRFGPKSVILTFLLAGVVDELISFQVLEKWEASGGSSTGYFGLYGLAIGTLFFYKDEDLRKWSRQFILPAILILLVSEVYFRLRGGNPHFLLAYNKSHLVGFFTGLLLSGVFPVKGYELNKKTRLIFTGLFMVLLALLVLSFYFKVSI